LNQLPTSWPTLNWASQLSNNQVGHLLPTSFSARSAVL